MRIGGRAELVSPVERGFRSRPHETVRLLPRDRCQTMRGRHKRLSVGCDETVTEEKSPSRVVSYRFVGEHVTSWPAVQSKARVSQ